MAHRHQDGSPLSRRRNPVRRLLFRSLLLLSAVISVGLFIFLILTKAVDDVNPSRDTYRHLKLGGSSDEVHLDVDLGGAGSSGGGAEMDPEEEELGLQEEVAEGLKEEEGEEVEEKGEKRADPLNPCATVEEMGEAFSGGSETESLRVREVIKRHFDLHGAATVRELPPSKFCRQGFVMGKASEAGFGNEMYKILTAAALSIMLNRSLIIGQTRQQYPFGDFISYTNHSFTLKEVKHLWRKNDCTKKYRRKLLIRIDNFEHPNETNVLCSNWKQWKQPIIWFQGTTDAVAIQFFLKNINLEMKSAAEFLFGQTDSLKSRPNVFGELMRAIITPAEEIKEAVEWVLKGVDPDVVLHMRMLNKRSVRAITAAVQCIKRALRSFFYQNVKPRIVLVSDTPSFIDEITQNLTDTAEVLHFDYKLFEGKVSNQIMSKQHKHLDFRVEDWGPAPRWVAFVDFFLASRAKHAAVSGAHRRVGTTYAQLIAALAAANQYGMNSAGASNFSFFSSFHSSLLVDGLHNQNGWGHIWNRFSGRLSCRRQTYQCAITPLLPPAWWDGEWQSPIPRDIQRLQDYGVKLTDTGNIVEGSIESFCSSRKDHVKKIPVFRNIAMTLEKKSSAMNGVNQK